MAGYVQAFHRSGVGALSCQSVPRFPTLAYLFRFMPPNGRSGGIRTHGILLPKQARYQLRYTPKKPTLTQLAYTYVYPLYGDGKTYLHYLFKKLPC